MRIATLGRIVTMTSVIAAGACSGDSLGPTVGDQNAAAAKAAGGKADTTVTIPNREWRLQTIRGVVLGRPISDMRDSMLLQYTQYKNGGVVIPNATIEVRKINLPSTDVGLVTTLRSDAEGKFQFVIDQPIIVRTGQPTPSSITYHLVITPPAGSPYAKRTGAQVIFAEQFAADQAVWEYYVFRP